MVKIRLRRMGAKKAPYYRIVVADSRSPRDGRCIEEIGTYNPLTEPATITVDAEKAQTWIKNGAQPTETVKALLKKAGVDVAICTDHPEVPIQYLPLSAGIAVRAGMDHDDAVRAITSVPAKILGLSDKIGSVAPGHDADLVVFKGDPLSVYETPVWVIAGGKIVKKP